MEIPSNVPGGTVTVLLSRDMTWIDACRQLGNDAMKPYHKKYSAIKYGLLFTEWFQKTYPHITLIVSSEPGDFPISPQLLDVRDERKVRDRLSHALNDIARNPKSWLVKIGSKEAEEMERRFG